MLSNEEGLVHMGGKFLLRACMISFCCSFLAFVGMSTFANAEPQTNVDYEKWSRIAMDVVKLNYPESKVSDYDYKGREEITETQAKDTFEIKVENQTRAFIARVTILFNPQTNSLLSLSIEETR